MTNQRDPQKTLWLPRGPDHEVFGEPKHLASQFAVEARVKSCGYCALGDRLRVTG